MIVHVLRKPLIGTVAANALQHGCGALNIDQCRVFSGATLRDSLRLMAVHLPRSRPQLFSRRRSLACEPDSRRQRGSGGAVSECEGGRGCAVEERRQHIRRQQSEAADG